MCKGSLCVNVDMVNKIIMYRGTRIRYVYFVRNQHSDISLWLDRSYSAEVIYCIFISDIAIQCEGLPIKGRNFL